MFFQHIPYLQPYACNVAGIIDQWKGYKFSVPTFGAILLDENMTHVLLVQSYCSKSSWGFPKGKINKDELPCQCAIREVSSSSAYTFRNIVKDFQIDKLYKLKYILMLSTVKYNKKHVHSAVKMRGVIPATLHPRLVS